VAKAAGILDLFDRVLRRVPGHCSGKPFVLPGADDSHECDARVQCERTSVGRCRPARCLSRTDGTNRYPSVACSERVALSILRRGARRGANCGRRVPMELPQDNCAPL
jgi:hypothetical protein